MRDLTMTIVGNLVGEPELRFTPSGVAVARFTVAHNRRVYDKGSESWKDGEPTYMDCTAWRQLAENIVESLTKGARVIVAGELETQRWKDKDDQSKTHSRLMLNVSAIGPDLVWQTASVKRMARKAGGPADDPWATGSAERPPMTDEPPF